MELIDQYKKLSEQLNTLDNLLHKELEKYFEFDHLSEYSDYRQYTKDGVTIQITVGWEGEWTISFPSDADSSREIFGNGDALKCTALEILNKTYVWE
jgi:hypothetical protein